MIIRDADLFVACQPQTVSDVWLNNLMFLSDLSHRAIVYECVHGRHGVNVFHETQATTKEDARGHRYDSVGKITKWVETRPVTHYPRRAGEAQARALPSSEVFYDKNGRRRKRRLRHGFLPIVCSPVSRQPVLHMLTSKVSL